MNTENRKLNILFFILTAAIFLIVISPKFLAEGMFFDGLIYATIARNLANGIGSFWHLSFSETLLTEFNGQPPLAFGIQSILYRILGDSILIEKFYSVSTILISCFIIILIWKEIGKNVWTSWISVLLYITVPTVIWASTNNLLENTMTIFVLISVLFYFKSLKKKTYLWLFLAGFCLLLGFFTKGLTALFPLAFPFIFWLIKRKTTFGKMVLETLCLFAGLLVPAILLFSFSSEAYQQTMVYFDTQIVNSLKNVVTVKSRFYILYTCLMDLIIAIAIVVLLVFIAWRKKWLKTITSSDRGYFLVFLLLALCAVLPVMVSMKQSSFYILSSFPFFALAFACLTEPIIIVLFRRISPMWTKIIGVFSFIFLLGGGILTFYYSGKIGRDRLLLEDIHTILPLISEGSIVKISPDLSSHWTLYTYLARYKYISVTKDDGGYEFLLLKKREDAHLYTEYQAVDIDTKTIFLYRAQTNTLPSPSNTK